MAYSDQDVSDLVDAVEEELERRRRTQGENQVGVQEKKRGWFRSLVSNVCNLFFGGFISWLVDKVMGLFGF